MTFAIIHIVERSATEYGAGALPGCVRNPGAALRATILPAIGLGTSSVESPAPSSLRFGEFFLDLKAGELRKAGHRIRLQPQPFKVLFILASRPGEAVTREEIQQQVWGSETFVDFERGLNVCVQQIRAALADDPEAPRFLETLPKRGYRFLASVERVAEVDAAAPSIRDAQGANGAAVAAANAASRGGTANGFPARPMRPKPIAGKFPHE